MASIIFVIVAALFNAAASFFAKLGASKIAADNGTFLENAIKLALNPYIIASVISFALSFFFYVYSLVRLNLSLAYPLTISVAFMLITLSSVLYFKEYIGVLHIAAFGLIVVGIWMLVLAR